MGSARAACILSFRFAFCRLVRCLMGETAISDAKLGHGNPLVILGVETTFLCNGARFKPSDDKATKWSELLAKALDENRLCSGEASKMSGRLQWASSCTFKRVGRAMLRPLYSQIKRRRAELTPALQLSLKWWRQVLQLGICEKRDWETEARRPVYLYCDARSTPPRAAAVLVRRVSFGFWVAQHCFVLHSGAGTEKSHSATRSLLRRS